jgi:hypothetical protein
VHFIGVGREDVHQRLLVGLLDETLQHRDVGQGGQRIVDDRAGVAPNLLEFKKCM